VWASWWTTRARAGSATTAQKGQASIRSLAPVRIHERAGLAPPVLLGSCP
jgi:hypothetical protein